MHTCRDRDKTVRGVVLARHPLCIYIHAGIHVHVYGSLSKNGGIVVLYNFLAYVPSIFLFLYLQHLATLWVNKKEYYVRYPMTLFENST